MGMYLMRRLAIAGQPTRPGSADFMVFSGLAGVGLVTGWVSTLAWFAFDGLPGARPLQLVFSAFPGVSLAGDRCLPVYHHSGRLNLCLMLAFLPLTKWAFGGNNGLTDSETLLGFNLRTECHPPGACFLPNRVALAIGFVIAAGL